GLLHLGRATRETWNLRPAEGETNRDLLARPLGAFRELVEQREPLGEIGDSLCIGRGLDGRFAGLPKASDGSLRQTTFGIMVRQERGVRSGKALRLPLQEVRDPTVVILSGRPQNRSVGGVLNERMFEA